MTLKELIEGHTSNAEYERSEYDNMDRISGIRKNIQDEIDAIWRKAYNAGYEDGYTVGGNDAKREISLSGEYERAYQRGLDDAWEVARKISKMQEDERRIIFNLLSLKSIIQELSVEQAREKIEEWEKQEKKCNDEIKVGDEVIFENENRAVVAHVDFGNQDYFDIIFANGETSYVSQYDVIKTGRHFDQIAEVLEQMGEKE